MIKLGTINDVETLLPLFKRFQQEFSPWECFSETKVLESFKTLVFNPQLQGLFAIAENDNHEPSGFLVAVAVPSLFSDEIQTQELAFFVVPEERKSRMARNLMKTYEYWAKNIVQTDICSVTLMDDRVGRLYERQGYQKAEVSYIKRMN